MDPISGFPNFKDGDVLVVLSPIRTYNLHAIVLRHSSNFFAGLIREETGAKLSSKAKNSGVKTRFYIELTTTRGNYGFSSKPVDSHGHSRGTHSLADIENGKVPSPIFKHYDNLFRSFYNVPLQIDTKNLATVVSDCMGLVGTAENHGALNSVVESVDVALLRQGQTLFKSISSDPAVWANFGEKIRSSTIFKEALIHLVGKWKLLTKKDREKLNDSTVILVEQKYQEVQLVKQALEVRMMSHYPAYMQKDPKDNPGRIQYASDIYGWMAMSLFRHWFTTQVLEKQNKDKDDGGASFYYALSHGGQAYLDRNQCADFHLYAPMTSKGRSVFENHLNAYKADIANFVIPLMRNITQLEIDQMNMKIPLGYLLNAEILDEDCPWAEKEVDAVDRT